MSVCSCCIKILQQNPDDADKDVIIGLNHYHNPMNCDVSVIITTCNRNLTVVSCAVHSVLSQTLPPKEIIVLDSGDDIAISNDIRQFIMSFDNATLRYIKTKSGFTGCQNRNYGFDISTGGMVAFLDDDDEWYPSKLESQMSLIGAGIGLIYSDYDVEVPDGTVKHFKTPIVVGKNIIGNNVIGCTSMPLISRQSFESVCGFDESFESNQEWDLWIRIVSVSVSVHCGECAGIKHYNKKSVSTSKKKRVQGWYSIFNKYRSEYKANPFQLKEASGCCCVEMFHLKSPFFFKALMYRLYSGISCLFKKDKIIES